MPEIRYYTVTQEREVKVSANSVVAAILIADAAFKNAEAVNTIEGHVTAPVRIRDISAREDL